MQPVERLLDGFCIQSRTISLTEEGRLGWVDGGREGRQHLATGRANLAQVRAHLDRRPSVDTTVVMRIAPRSPFVSHFFFPRLPLHSPRSSGA